MAEDLFIPQTADKRTMYETLIPQLKALIDGEPDLVANLANVAAALKETFQFFWVGFYIVKDRQLVLGPFQGPPACARIDLGKGVCGAAWEKRAAVIVPDVNEFPGHIACSAASKSEIVIPILINDVVKGVLDVDSDRLDHFDEVDEKYLTEIALAVGGSF